MQFREIAVGELPDFIRSEEYKKLQPKPITALRAISQFKNPHARKEDAALVFASENNTLLAFAGLLPHKVPGFPESVFSNSGWWVHPKLGRKLGLRVFLKAFQGCGRRMFFTDSPAYTKSILEKTGLFMFFSPVNGNRFFLRFYSGALLRRRGAYRLVTLIFSTVDKMLNAIFDLRFSFLLKKNFPEKYDVESVNTISPELAAFIEKNPGNSILHQDSARLNWIVCNPWVTIQKETPVILYPFTYRADSFIQKFLIVKLGAEIKALLMISIRDNHASVPFIYFKKDSLMDVAYHLWFYLIQSKTDSLVVFHPDLLEALKQSGTMWLFKKNITRYAGCSNELNAVFAKERYFQDGEGDAAFT